jgi:hypothetical protein
MADWISDRLRRVSTGWVVLAATAVFVAFIILVLPRQAASGETETGSGESPDMSFYYTAADLYRMAEAYGEQGRRAYVRVRWTFDLVWPLVYAAFLGTAISWVFGRAFAPDSRWQRITRRANLVPLLGMGFDYLENLSASLVILRYPARTAVVDTLAPLFTMVKWVFVNGSFLVLLGGVGFGVWRWIKRRKDRDAARI